MIAPFRGSQREDGEKRADRIVDDRFPTEDLRRPAPDIEVSEKRSDHGRAGDDHDPAEQGGDAYRKAGAIIRGGGAQRPADRDPDQDREDQGGEREFDGGRQPGREVRGDAVTGVPGEAEVTTWLADALS